MAQYDDDIAVIALGSGSYSAELPEGWTVGGGINGGYQLSVIGNAIRAELGEAKPDPITVSAYYLGPGRPGPATVTTQVRRDGRSLGVVAADLVQEGQTKITALATFGDVARLEAGADVRTTAIPPELPPIEQCVSTDFAPDEVKAIAPMFSRFEFLFHPDHIGWTVGAPRGQGEFAAWFRFRDQREADTLSLLTICDLLPPVTFDLGMPGWAPTLELTVHVRAVPAPGWLMIRHATRNVAGGMFEEDCEVWDSAGRLVAQSRQLARLPRRA